MMTSDKKQLIKAFLQTVGHDIRHYQALLPLLKAQRALYLTFDANLLDANTKQQLPLLAALKRSSNERSQSLIQLGLSADDNGITRLLSVLPNTLSTQAKNQWSMLKNLIEQCQKYNAENGQTSASFHEMLSQMTTASSPTYQENTL
ncbi:flagellar protein FlgN [Grimontia sp. NTOU-MAR1]|uniref:flagellar protein FlgN n=1 Tax=Grimontia sp. NTOU-MAR1 TaxID=3111011 RepID=UPI002DBA40BA|nr:flagellar protein FlgN [Grimontia sp. NTOU-MAR1]WRV98760.1 flagellar protein FlgN [Grimontia sp. NTOU-MAR1]